METPKQHKKLVILTGGGTGGHIFPLLSVGKELKKESSDIRLKYFGSGLRLEKDSAIKDGVEYQKIFCGKFRRYVNFWSVFKNVGDFFMFLFGFFQAIFIFIKGRPDVIFSKGGYVSLPSVLAGAILKIPIISHESDIMPGLANRIAMNFSRRLCVAFPLDAYQKAIRYRALYVGLPLLEGFKKRFDMLPKSGEYILIVGGSQGASELNQLVFDTATDLLQIKPIFHITGTKDFEKANDFKLTLPKDLQEKYILIKFSKNMDELIGDSTLVIARAGASSIFEIAACHKKALFIPIRKEVTAHQIYNAKYLKKIGLAEVFYHGEPKRLFIGKVKELIKGDNNKKLDQIFFGQSSEVISRVILDEIDKQKFKKIHKIFLIGIGGVSMKGIAALFRAMGKKVWGSDLRIGGHNKDNISRDIDLVVYSSAADQDSPAKVEHEEARRLHIPIIKRPEAVAILMQGHTGISISGMHGKTTISTLVARIFDEAIFGPSYLIGAESTRNNRTFKLGRGEHFIAEACEYDDAFLSFPTTVALISNIEEEHLDFFKGGLPEIKKHFSDFVRKIRPGGCLVYCADDFNTYDVVKENFDNLTRKKIKIISYGFKPSANISINNYCVKDKITYFNISTGKKSYQFESSLPGKHFVLNCAASVAISSYFGISFDLIKKVIADYKSVSRRFAKVGSKKGVLVYDDYAHHPTEISATMSALNDFKAEGRKVVIFQPHQQKRLNALYAKFVSSFAKSKEDVLIVLPVHKVPGRDEGESEMHTSRELAHDILKKTNKNIIYVESYDNVLKLIQKESKKGDIILTMGATDVFKIGERFLQE